MFRIGVEVGWVLGRLFISACLSLVSVVFIWVWGGLVGITLDWGLGPDYLGFGGLVFCLLWLDRFVGI